MAQDSCLSIPVMYTGQLAGRRKPQRSACHFSLSTSQTLHMTLVFISHWPELKHMATQTEREARNAFIPMSHMPN